MNNVQYVTQQLEEQTKYKSIRNAIHRNNVSIVVVNNNTWYMEHSFGHYLPDKLYLCIRHEMERLFNQYTYLYDLTGWGEHIRRARGKEIK